MNEPTPFIQHSIDNGDHEPIAVPPYRMNPVKADVLTTELDNLLEKNIIQEYESPWAAPVVFVPKKNGGTRLCVDYRRMNAITVSDSYPLPHMDDLLHATKRSYYISIMDLRSGYHQVQVNPRDVDKTAFTTPYGTFRYLRMPLGLLNAPATFQRLVDYFRRGLTDIRVLVYLDDLIVLSETFDNHLKDLELVFSRLRLFRLLPNREKCSFVCTSVRYLGHVITADGIQVDPDKTGAIARRTVPRNVKDVQSFL